MERDPVSQLATSDQPCQGQTWMSWSENMLRRYKINRSTDAVASWSGPFEVVMCFSSVIKVHQPKRETESQKKQLC